MLTSWPRWLRVLTAPLWLPFVALGGAIVLVIILPLSFAVGAPASFVVTAMQRRKWRRAHSGEAILLCSCVDARDRCCDLALREFYRTAVSGSLPARCALMLFEGVLDRDQELVLKVSTGAKPKLKVDDWPAVMVALRRKVRSISIRGEMMRCYSAWRSGADVRAEVTRIITQALQELSAGD